MKNMQNLDTFEVGYDIPAKPGMDEADIQTPCLVLDLDALERNIKKMGDYASAHGMRHRVHGKMHKSVDVAKLQEELGGAVGVCCQKVSEAEVFVRGGIKDVLVSNQVRDPAKIDRLARLPKLGSRIIVCVDDISNVADLAEAAAVEARHTIGSLCRNRLRGRALRCDHYPGSDRNRQARWNAADNLSFTGIQAYQGAMQHLDTYEDRKEKLDVAIAMVQDAVDGLEGGRHRVRAGLRRRHRFLLFRVQLRGVQRAAVRLLRLHGCGLRPHPGQGRQPDRPRASGKTPCSSSPVS